MTDPRTGAKPRRLVAGNRVFFPAATAYAIFVLPASVLAMTGMTGLFPALAFVTGHAHEMLFGFALAVVAGNQLGPMVLQRLVILFVFWALARATFLFAPQSIAADAANVAFAALLAAHIAPRLLRAAKKLRNQALPLVLIAICASGIVFQLASRGSFAAAQYTILSVAVLLFALLMLFMGGRLIAPAIAGQFYRQGGNLDARVQPRIEAGLIVATAIAAATAAFPGERLLIISSAVATAVAGVLAAVRLVRWRLWALRGRPDLLCLAAGYGWLAVGLLLFAAALAAGRHQTAAIHVITVGSLGTLTLNVMAMSWVLKARQNPAPLRLPVWGTILIALATLARVLAGSGVDDPRTLLLLASFCWSGAFMLLLVLFVRVRRPSRNGDGHAIHVRKSRDFPN